MTREEALDEYHAAIGSHKVEDLNTKQRVQDAFKALGPFLENGKIPLDLKRRFEAK